MNAEGGNPGGTSGGGSPPNEDDLDSDVGTIFSDEEEEGKRVDDDDDETEFGEGGQVSDGESGSSSSDSDDGSEKCPICLQRFTDQEVGSPEMCEHQFCLRCITAWSKKVATCPIDRKYFATILVKKSWDGEVVRIDNVQLSNAQTESEQYDSTPTYCEICGRCDREERLLLCDGCDLGYHMECLDPPLEYVPIEDWFCPRCIELGVNLDEEEAEAQPSTSSRATNQLVRIPRTLQNERILQSIDVPQSAINDVIEAVMQGLNAATSRSERPPSTPRNRKPRKSTPRKRKSATSGGTRRKRRTKRKTRRRRRVAVDKRPNTARGRIAHHLGIMKPLPGQVYVGLPPSCKSAGSSSHSSSSSASTSTITSLRYSAGITPLRMFGNPSNDLSDLPDSWSDDEGPLVLSSARVPPLQRSLGATLKGPPAVVASSSAGSCDVLGSILKKQYILLHDKNMKISRDGTLVPSINSSKLPSLGGTPTSPKHSPTTAASSPSRGDGAGSSRVEPRPTTCGVSNTNQPPSNLNQPGPASDNSSSGSTAATASGRGAGNTEGNTSEINPRSGQRSSGNAGQNEDSFADDWDVQNERQADDDDFNIYSDIEENSQETEQPEQVRPPSVPIVSAESKETDTDGEPRKISTEAKLSGPDFNESHDSDMDEMVIDEDSMAAAGSGTKSEQQSPRKDSESHASNTADDDRAGTPLVDEPNSNFLDSPESIPLPPSPPEPEENEQEGPLNGAKLGSEPIPATARKEYDPSEPLTSSDEDEPPKPKSPPKSSKRSPSPKPQRKRFIGNRPLGRGLNTPAFKDEQKKGKPAQSAPSPQIDLSSIPIPSEEARRPVIHFSIPKRHNLIPISSLMKRQKGVAKKESKGEGCTINFQSEISKVFGGESQDGAGDDDAGEDEGLPKISLVAEIFGSDDEEDDVGNISANQAQPLPPEEDSHGQEEETDAKGKDASIDVSSGRWKTVSEVVPQITPSPTGPQVSVPEEPEKRASEAQEEPEIIEIVTLNCPVRPPPRRFLGPQDVETISDTSNSDIEVLNEVNTPSKDKSERSRGRDKSRSKSRSRSSSRKRRERKRRHSSSSADSYVEDGEIEARGLGAASARKRRKDKQRKEKNKRKHGSQERRHSQGGMHSNISSTSEGEDDENTIAWKKPSKRSSERNYRGDKIKSSRDKESSTSPSYRSSRKRESASPRHRQESPSRSRYSRSASRSRTSWSRRRSRSGSSNHSYNSRRRSHLRTSLASHLLGHSRSPSHSPEPIRSRSSHARRRSRSSSEEGRLRGSNHRRKTKRRSPSRSRSPEKDAKKNKSSSQSSSALDAIKRKKAKSLKKAEKVLKIKRKNKELRLKERLGKKKLGKSRGESIASIFGDERSSGKGKPGKDKGDKKKRKREKSLSPVKAIVADGDSIVVSLSFQKDTSSHSAQGDRSSGGKSNGKKSREAKSRSSSKLKENAAKLRSPSVNKSLMDLGAEDLSSNSESSGIVPKDKEIGAPKVSSSADGSAAENYKTSATESKHADDNGEVQGDSLVTSTRDSLEPSATNEDDYPNSTGSPKAPTTEPGNKLTSLTITSSAHSPRIQGGPVALSGPLHAQQTSNQPPDNTKLSLGQKVLAASATSAAMNLMSTQPPPAAPPHTMSTPVPQIRYPAPNSILNPVLATVASALLAVRNHNTPGMSGSSNMPSIGKQSRSKARSSHGNFQGGDGSPLSPNSSDGDDLFEPPTEHGAGGGGSSSKKNAGNSHQQKGASNSGNMSNLFDSLFGSEPPPKQNSSRQDNSKPNKSKPQNRQLRKAPKKESLGPPPNQCDINLNEDVPASAVELSVQEKLINKINRQERVVEEVKVCLKPHYIKKHVNKEEYKEILRRAVPKICHSKTGEINPVKVRELVDAYVKKFRHGRKKPA